MSKELRIRFRHPAGDVGPQGFPDHATVQQLKSALHQSWPQDGPLAAEMPHSVDDIKIILGGKFLDSQQVLGDLRPAMGEPKPDTVVTVHMLVRPAGAPKSHAKDKDLVKGRSSCCCIQ